MTSVTEEHQHDLATTLDCVSSDNRNGRFGKITELF